ncbi:MAG: malonyl-ACP O-methyltransferase BioC [Gammaproteobacteria bacterium]|nr:malonyl-ACP O-methyltransferase BioC [Gammaproteobacteria bacterium]
MKISKDSVKAAFAKAALSYNDSAVVQKEILVRLVEKLKVLQKDSVDTLLDVGSGTGLASELLREHYGSECYYAIDFASPMLAWAKNQFEVNYQYAVCGDVEVLPFRDNSLDVIFSASTFQWCNDVGNAFQECSRTLKEQGLLIFSSFGPETLRELRHCFAQVDDYPHVSSFIDMQSLGDGLLANGFDSPVMESEIITVEYNGPMQLLRDLQATGATNHIEQRLRGLMTRQHLNDVIKEYNKFILPNGKFPASYEVLYGHGWKKNQPSLGQNSINTWQPIKFS